MTSGAPQVPDEATELAARAQAAIFGNRWELLTERDRAGFRRRAQAALAAALPVLRRRIADEIETQRVRGEHPGLESYRDGWNDGINHAARVVRDGDT